MMPWDEKKERARYEVIIRDRALNDHIEARAKRAGLSVAEYLQLLARAVMLLEQGDPMLVSMLGLSANGAVPSAPPARSNTPSAADPLPGDEPEPPPPDNRLIDGMLDQFNL